MLRPHLSHHVLPAIIAVSVSLLAPLLVTPDSSEVHGIAGSATARAAVHEIVAAPEVRFANGSQAMTAARELAQQEWGGVPCSGTVEIVWSRLDDSTNATAAWRNPSDAWNNAGENFDCRIEFNAAGDYDWPKLCTVMAHEIGHLLGHPHSESAATLMSPIYSTPIERCTGPEPGAPVPVASPEPPQGAESPVASARAAKRATAAKRSQTRAATAKKKALRFGKARTKAKKRCVRRFRAGRSVRRCGKAKRAARAGARPRRSVAKSVDQHSSNLS